MRNDHKPTDKTHGKRMTSLIERLESFNGRPLKASQLAKELGISKETVLRRAKKGIYPSFRQGRTVYFNPSALIRYFQQKGV